MAIEVNNTTPGGQRVQDSQRNRVAGENSERTVVGDAPKDRDAVKISSDAQRIRETQSQLERESAIDAERVEKIKSAISRGEYPLDNARIAERFVALESQLDG